MAMTRLEKAVVVASISKHIYDRKPLVTADKRTSGDWNPTESNRLDAAWEKACENYIAYNPHSDSEKLRATKS